MKIIRHRFWSFFVWPLAAVLLAFSAYFPFLSASAVEYGGIGGRPAYPRAENPRTESIFIHTLNPGTVQDEGVLLVNNSEEKKTLLVYAVDSVVSSGGAFACRQMSEPKEDVGAWIALEKEEVVLNPGANELVPFFINVPISASVGEHNGCIVIQEKKDAPTTEQAGVNLSFRTGLRVAVSIPGEITRQLEIVSFSREKQADGSIMLKPSVKNLGNVSVDADVKVVTKNLFGRTYLTQGGEFPVLRGQVSDWNFEVKKPFWGGWYRSKLTVEYESDVATEIGEHGDGPNTVLKGGTVSFFSFPKPLALAIEVALILLIIFGLFLWKLSIKRKRWIKNEWREGEAGAGDDIRSLAEKNGVSWRIIAKANRLKAPYTLKSGQKLKLPPRK